MQRELIEDALSELSETKQQDSYRRAEILVFRRLLILNLLIGVPVGWAKDLKDIDFQKVLICGDEFEFLVRYFDGKPYRM